MMMMVSIRQSVIYNSCSIDWTVGLTSRVEGL